MSDQEQIDKAVAEILLAAGVSSTQPIAKELATYIGSQEFSDNLNKMDSEQSNMGLLESLTGEPLEPKICEICGPICECRKKLCTICHEPITLGTFHESCAACVYCGNTVGIQVLDRLIREENSTCGMDWNHKLIVYHQPCHDRKLREDFDKKPVTITQAHLTMINRVLACNGFIFDGANIVPQWNNEVTVDTNQQKTEIAVQAFMLDMTSEQRFAFVKTMEAAAMQASICLARDPKGSLVAIEVTRKDADRYKALEKERKNQIDTEAKKIRKNQNDSEYLIMMANERNDTTKQLRARRLAIESVMKIMGMDEATATAWHDEKVRKNKKVSE